MLACDILRKNITKNTKRAILLSITGYHTCKADGGWSFIRAMAPFISRDNPGQWLTQGYYFWTDVPRHAVAWGNINYPNNYAIVKCKIQIEQDDLLDLVGNLEHLDFFEARMKRYKARLIKSGKSKDESESEGTVSTCLAWMRKIAETNDNFFPYIAVKAQDTPNLKHYSFRKGKVEQMPTRTRQQLCLFRSASDCIVEKEIFYPNNYAVRATPVVSNKP